MNLTKEQRIAKHKDFLKANWQALAAFSWEHYKSDQFCLAIPRWVQKCSLGIFKNWKIAALFKCKQPGMVSPHTLRAAGVCTRSGSAGDEPEWLDFAGRIARMRPPPANTGLD